MRRLLVIAVLGIGALAAWGGDVDQLSGDVRAEAGHRLDSVRGLVEDHLPR